MAKGTVIMPDETSILNMTTAELQVLGVDAELLVATPVYAQDGVTVIQTNYAPTLMEEVLRQRLLTIRALFDGRQFNTPRADLIALAQLIVPDFASTIDSSVTTPQIALSCAYFFDTAP